MVIGCSLYTALVLRRVELPEFGGGRGAMPVRCSNFYWRLSDICPKFQPLDVVRGFVLRRVLAFSLVLGAFYSIYCIKVALFLFRMLARRSQIWIDSSKNSMCSIDIALARKHFG